MRQKWLLAILGIALVVGMFALPPAPAAKAGTCYVTTATWAGQRGWDRWYNPNYMVDFRANVAGITHAVYYRGVLVGPSWIVSVRDYYEATKTTAFGISTKWAVLNPGWSTASNWKLYYCP